jgi:hypothetical protein
MHEGKVVSNTSPLLNLALVDRLDLLESQFASVTIPDQVWAELAVGEEGLAALRQLRSDGFLVIESVDCDDLFVELARELDAGEAAAVRYAIEHDADLVLLDEREGRKAARRHGLDVTGVVGVLLRGAEAGAVDLRLELDRLREAGFWLSDDLYEAVLERGESSE